jgi:hypothetical protein
MKNKLLLLLMIGWSGNAAAQLSLGNLAEYQVGNLPFDRPADLTTFYNQLNLSYHWRDWRAGFKLERFQRPLKDKDYTEFSQRSLRYSRGNFEAAAGNFYEIIGRGLLLRSYEIPGTLLENLGQRVRYGFYRDLDGALLKYQSERLELKLLRGKPLLNTFPPSFSADLRRRHLLEAIESKLRLVSSWTLGGAYLRDHLEGQVQKLGSVSVAGNLPHNIQIYSEFAQRLDRLGAKNRYFDLSDRSAHAFYSSFNFTAGPFGMSAEFKDYSKFFLEYNDPPPLVKEHPYAVLNRSTHFIEPNNETGWQMEIFFNTKPGHTAILNWTRTDSRPFENNNRFEEWFAELGLALNELTALKTFFDISKDQLVLEKDRYAAGLYLERELPRQFGVTLDLEYQTLQKTFTPAYEVKNYVAALTVSKAPRLSSGIIWERSTDPLQTDNPETLAVERKARHWLGCSLGYQFNNHYLVNLFYGKRRGGPACTSGICYEVLDFEGLEVRANVTF